jgi:predicted nucleic-acid-binding Zn-ribbon protein
MGGVMTAAQVPTSNGQPMRCVMCGWTEFETKAWKLNTTGMEFMDMAWANRNATCLVCQRCRFIHWFHL